jgi:hypothetical protein
MRKEEKKNCLKKQLKNKKKIVKTIFYWAWWCMAIYNPSYVGSESSRMKVQGWLRQKHQILSEKQTKSKRTGGAAEVAKWQSISLGSTRA